MTEDHCVELPGHVVAKIEKVLGIPPSKLSEHDLVTLIEELCDTALMFEREERDAGQRQQENPEETRPAPPQSGSDDGA